MNNNLRRAAIAAALQIITTSMALADPGDVLVDPTGLNHGSLTNALQIGGPEPMDPLECRKVTVAPVPGSSAGTSKCPSVTTMEGIASTRVWPSGARHPVLLPPPNQFGLDLYTDNVARVSVTHEGRVGFGNQTPRFNVHLKNQGDVQIALESTDTGHRLWTIQSSGAVNAARSGSFQIVDRDQNVERLGIDATGMVSVGTLQATGMVSVGTLQITGGSDLAEPFKMERPGLPKGSIVSIDTQHPGDLTLSKRAYDRRVAGIVSGAGGIEPGIRLTAIEAKGDSVALSGRVYALADARSGSISPGDLLTTSNTPGYCMKVQNYGRAQGAVIGKAMSALHSGRGMILVLVTHQ
jgi:hypothetical protein